MHTEEELIKVVELLAESYGFSEEEAIDLVNEALTLGSAARGIAGMYKDSIDTHDKYKNLKDTSSLHSPEEIKKARNNYYKASGKAAAATALGAVALGYAAKDAKDKYPKFKAKLDRERMMKKKIKRMKRRMRSY